MSPTLSLSRSPVSVDVAEVAHQGFSPLECDAAKGNGHEG